MPHRAVEEVVCDEFEAELPTHEMTPCGPIPTVFDPNGIYPYVSYCDTSATLIPKKHRFITLENRHLKATISPDLGGRVTSLIHKASGKEVLLPVTVILPVRILPRFCFVPGGIEVSFPVSHSPTQNEKVLWKIDLSQPRAYVTCGERELRFGMQWSVEYSLGQEDTCLTQRVLLRNPGNSAYPWMSWSNAALPSAADTEFHFPDGEVLSHASRIQTIDWQEQGPRRESDIREMTGFFWRSCAVNAFGVYTPSLRTGLYHIADPALAPGIKLWSYGIGADREWSTVGSPQAYVEIQGGPAKDQSIKLELKPSEIRWHVEYWIPTDQRLDIRRLELPGQELRPINEIPLFEWARPVEVRVWKELLKAHEHSLSQTPKVAAPSRAAGPWPEPPPVSENCWPPSGMEDLGTALEWAIDKSTGSHADLWKFYYGAWLAGRGQGDAAIRILSECTQGAAQSLLARLYRMKKDPQSAAAAFDRISERSLQLHPQIVVERDQALRELGLQALPQRQRWLSVMNSLHDERIIERKVQLLIDQGDVPAAKSLLLSTPFQKVHQTYTRTELWKQICAALGEPWQPIPDSLGEDRLAQFGAYREFESRI